MAGRNGNLATLTTHFLTDLAQEKEYGWLAIMPEGRSLVIIDSHPESVARPPEPICECPRRVNGEDQIQLELTLQNHAQQRE